MKTNTLELTLDLADLEKMEEDCLYFRGILWKEEHKSDLVLIQTTEKDYFKVLKEAVSKYKQNKGEIVIWSESYQELPGTYQLSVVNKKAEVNHLEIPIIKTYELKAKIEKPMQYQPTDLTEKDDDLPDDDLLQDF